MKKLFLAVIAVLGFALTASAQDSKKVVKEVKKEVKKVGDTKTKTTTVVLKKDGTPDKRYKETKKVILKKDGTPDKRYK